MSFPFFGEEFTFTQPDGSQIQVRGWGDQYHATFETLDGYTVVEDPSTGFYHYATIADDGEEYRSIGVRPGVVKPQTLGLQPGRRINEAAAKAQAQTGVGLPRGGSRWETRRAQTKGSLRVAMAAPDVFRAPPKRETVGDYTGLCLLVQFPDVPATITPAEVEAFCNQPGYNGFGNHGSVYDYFYDNSLGKLRYKNLVTPYYMAKHPRAYYTDERIPQPMRARELIKEALSYWRSHGFDFSQLTTDDADYVYAVNVFYSGTRVNNWAKGLWPHSYHLLMPYKLTTGKQAFDYQITDMGNQLTLGTFCHENGHMICDFPDLYDYGFDSFKSRGVGVYCLMCFGGNANKQNPTQIGAYLKYQAGWSDTVTNITPGLNAMVRANKNEFFIHRKSFTEYFIVENRHAAQRDEALTGSGLAVWHVDELGSNENQQMTPTSHYECSLVQADGNCDLEYGTNNGDNRDLFCAEGNNHLADATVPNSRWWDGTPSNLEVYNIGPAAETITFLADVT